MKRIPVLNKVDIELATLVFSRSVTINREAFLTITYRRDQHFAGKPTYSVGSYRPELSVIGRGRVYRPELEYLHRRHLKGLQRHLQDLNRLRNKHKPILSR